MLIVRLISINLRQITGNHPKKARAKHDRRKFIGFYQRFAAVMLRPYGFIYTNYLLNGSDARKMFVVSFTASNIYLLLVIGCLLLVICYLWGRKIFRPY
jgi:hypothetical protein